MNPHTGVLLTNLGTPDAPTPKAVRRYLKEFLWDPRVIDLPRPLWWLILNGIVLNTRPRKSARLYQSIWTDQGSPLLAISQQQRTALETSLNSPSPYPQQTGKLASWRSKANGALVNEGGRGRVHVVLGMRYGNPSIVSALDDLRKNGCTRLIVLPLYPQYSSASTASTFDAVATELKTWKTIPDWRMVHDYHDDSRYIAALAESVKSAWASGGQGELLLVSFHGLPQRYVDEGDVYFEQCRRTTALLAEQLGLSAERIQLAFQSRFGREAWIKPYTDEILRLLPRQGITRIDVICPGFAADCLETLQEAAMENRRIFLESGGREYRYIPALNDRPAHIELLAQLIIRHL